MIIWVIGLSSSGKTTIGTLLAEQLRRQHNNVAFLDGDVLREIWGDSPGHDIEGRRVNARRVSQLCYFLDQQGIHVVAAVLSIFPEWQAWNRKNFSKYFEVFLDAPLEMVKARDAKGIYCKAERGEIHNVVGVDIVFPRPQADLVVTGEELMAPPLCIVENILQSLDEFAG